jgi:hypothetical protein
MTDLRRNDDLQTGTAEAPGPSTIAPAGLGSVGWLAAFRFRKNRGRQSSRLSLISLMAARVS